MRRCALYDEFDADVTAVAANNVSPTWCSLQRTIGPSIVVVRPSTAITQPDGPSPPSAQAVSPLAGEATMTEQVKTAAIPLLPITSPCLARRSNGGTH